MLRILVPFAFSIFLSSFCYAQEEGNSTCFNASFACVKAEDFPSISYSPTNGVQVTVWINEKLTVVYTIKSGEQQSQVEIPDIVEGVPRNIFIEDYNFDGLLDFSIVEDDGGMGTNDVYRICVYSKKGNRFTPYSYIDGNSILNLVVDKKRKRLLVTCWSSPSPQPRQCKVNLPQSD
jgi:hypothetical protein